MSLDLSPTKKKSLYAAAFTILILAALFGAIGGILALLIIRDAFPYFMVYKLDTIYL